MATTVAVVGAGAAVASAGAQAYSSSQAGKGGGGPPTIGPASLADRLFNRGTRNLLDQERRLMNDALAQARFVQPEMYKLLGFEPVYDTSQDANIEAFGQKADALRGQLDSLDMDIAGMKGGKRRKKLRKQRDRVMKQLTIADRQLSDAQAVGRRVVSLRPLDPNETPDPTGSPDNLFRTALDLQNQTLLRALKGEEPIDATLKTEYEERERDLRDRLRRSLGPDYEDSTAGANALANFAREKAESFEQFNRQTVKDFSAMTESRANALSNLTGARLQQLLAPANAQANLAGALGGVSKDRLAYTGSQREERALQAGIADYNYQAERQGAADDANRIAGIANAVGGLAGGFSSLSGNPALNKLDKYIPGTDAYKLNSSANQYESQIGRFYNPSV